jgi:hypothetical protein
MRRVTSLVTLVVVLWAGSSAAGPWRGYAALTTGAVLDHTSGIHARGGALQAYVGVETPFGLSLGLVGEGAQTWGASFDGGLSRTELDYMSLGAELRLRFMRDDKVNPWVGLRVAQSRSTPYTFKDLKDVDLEEAPMRMLQSGLSTALRLGVDAWFGEHLGLTASTAWQWCDVRVDSDKSASGKACTNPLHSVLLGPTLRF